MAWVQRVVLWLTFKGDLCAQIPELLRAPTDICDCNTNGFVQKTEEDLLPHTSVGHSWCRNGINTILVCSPRIILYICRKLFVQRDVTRRKKCRETNYTHPAQHNARHDLQPPRRWWDRRMSDEGERMEDGGEATWERRSPRWPRCCGRMWCAGVGPHRHAHKQKGECIRQATQTSCSYCSATLGPSEIKGGVCTRVHI